MIRQEEILSVISKIRDKANRLIVEELKKRGVEGLSPSHGGILILLYKTKGPVCMKDVAERIGKDKSTVTVLINKLVKMGYVRKSKDGRDSRITLINLDSKGREIEEIFFEISHDLIDRLYKDFKEEEKNVLMEKLEKLYLNL